MYHVSIKQFNVTFYEKVSYDFIAYIRAWYTLSLSTQGKGELANPTDRHL